MSETNKEKAKEGNNYQAQIFTNHITSRSDTIYTKNNNRYFCPNIGIKVSDIEVVLNSKPNIKIVFETTTTSREDRYWGKEVQAKLIKKQIKSAGYQTIYVLLVPNDSDYDADSKEPHNHKKFMDLVNNGKSKKEGVGAIDIMIKEDAMDSLIEYIKNSKSENANRIITNYKKKYL